MMQSTQILLKWFPSWGIFPPNKQEYSSNYFSKINIVPLNTRSDTFSHRFFSQKAAGVLTTRALASVSV